MNDTNKRLYDEFIDYLNATQKSEQTIKAYKGILYNFLEDVKDRPFTELKKKDFVVYQGGLIANGKSVATIHMYKACISSFANFIQDICDEEYPNYKNPVTRIPNPASQPKRSKTIWNTEEVIEVIDRLIEHEHIEIACLVALALYSGRRRMELTRFKVKDFDTTVFNGSMYKTSPIKTKGRSGGKMLECYILSDVKPYLDKWLEIKPQGEYLFLSHKTYGTLTSNEMSDYARIVNRYTEKHFYWHSLRHLFVTNLLRKGIPSNIVQDIIGWDSADMLKVYNDISKDEQIAKYFEK